MDERLVGKIVAIAKRGFDGEKENAINILKKLCFKHHLNFDELMQDTEKVQEYDVSYKSDEMTIVAHIIMRYGTTAENQDLFINRKYKKIYFTATVERYIETMNAIDTLTKLYRKEKKRISDSMLTAFAYKHRLFRDYEYQGETRTKKSDDDRGAVMAIMSTLEDVEIQKRLSGKK